MMQNNSININLTTS